MQTHLVPTSIMFHQGYPAAWQCRLIWNRAQGGRATIWVIWLLHRIEPTVLGLFQILSTKSCFCLHQTSQHQGHLGPTASISAKVSKPQTHQAIVGPFERPVLVSSLDHSTASMFLFARTWSSSKLSSHSKQMQGGNRQPLAKCHNVSPLFAEERIRGYVPLIVIDRSLSKWLASFLPKLRHKGHEGSKTTDVSLYSTAFLNIFQGSSSSSGFQLLVSVVSGTEQFFTPTGQVPMDVPRFQLQDVEHCTTPALTKNQGEDLVCANATTEKDLKLHPISK